MTVNPEGFSNLYNVSGVTLLSSPRQCSPVSSQLQVSREEVSPEQKEVSSSASAPSVVRLVNG
jgi:hypothetical protein